LLACSYGPDSLALFYLLMENKIDFDVAYVNYHLPYTGDVEEGKLKKLTEKYKKTLYLKDAHFEKGNEEGWARDVRYNFFIEILKEHKEYDAVLVAHNLDDLIETYFLQLLRKGYFKYYGLEEVSYKRGIKIIRPLLKYRKKELENYLKINGYDYFIDTSNLEPVFERNRIRLASVSKYNDKECKKISKIIKERNKNEQKRRKGMMEYVNQDKTINVEEIRFMGFEDFVYLFYTYLDLFPFIKKISRKELENIYDIIEQYKERNYSFYLNNGYYIFIDYGYFKIDKIHEANYSFLLDKNGNEYFHFKEGANFNEIFSKYDKILIHPVSKDEYYKYKDKKKKISRMFIDMKLPISYRKIWPGVYNENGELLYVPRYKKRHKIEDSSFLIFDLNFLLTK